LVLLFSIYWIFFFDANKLKPQISAQFQKLTGREIVFHGDVGLTIFPSLGFQLQDVSIKNIKGFDPKTPYVKAKEADVRVYLLPLLIRHVRFERVMLNDVVINLIKNKQGDVNWKLPGMETEQKKSGSDEGIRHEISIKKVSVKNITINWRNLQKNTRGHISNINLIANKITQREYFPVEFTFSAFNQKTKSKTNFSLTSQIKIDRIQHKYFFKDIQLAIDSGKAAKRKRAQLQFIGNFKVTPDEIHIKKSQLIKNGDIVHVDNLEISGFENVVDFELPNLIKKLQISADLHSKQFKLRHTTVYDLVAKVRSENHVIQLYPLRAKVFSGKLNGKITLDARKDALLSRLNGSLSNFNLQSFLASFFQVRHISGTANFKANLSAQGILTDKMLRTLRGNIGVKVNNGVIKGVNIERMIRTARAMLSLSLPPLMETSNQTRFDNSEATLQINNGIVTNQNLKMESKNLIIQGAGKLNLINQMIDYKIEAKLKGKFWEGDWLVPINIKGNFTNPNVSLDRFSLLHEVSKNIMPRNIILRAGKIILTPFRVFFQSFKPAPTRPK
jgi:AsmA protein